MSSAAGVISVYEDKPLHPMTTRSPAFLGLDPGFGAWKETDFGDGIIIGFIDSGIWPECPSFKDSGLSPVRSSWKGWCVDAEDFNSTTMCSNKLVGAKAFTAGGEAIRRSQSNSRPSPRSPRDQTGHGTFVASTAAGSEVKDVGIGVFARGTLRGVAPKARIAMYKVGDETPISDVVAAMDAAVKDGVDLLSMSIGYLDPPPFHRDALAIAAFGAESRGVPVVLAGGNIGPSPSTVINLAPWMITVGAGTLDRVFPAMLNLVDGSVLTGQSLYSVKANGATMVPLVSIPCTEEDHLTPGEIRERLWCA